MYEKDPSPLPISKMELAVTIMTRQYMPSLPQWPGDSHIYHLLPTSLLSRKIPSISTNSPQSLMPHCF